jgi:tRNA(Ile)-lysidine synthase
MRIKISSNQAVVELEEGLMRSYRRLIRRGQGVLLAVSGGPDSMTLMSASARLAGRLGVVFEVATVDHQLRSESGAEVDMVGRAAQVLGLPHHGVVGRVEAHAAGIEERARVVRYGHLQALRSARKLDFIATAHTANDQAETLLMRLARGAALGGAQGIHERRADHIVRPMLFATRAQVERYVQCAGVHANTDAMNLDPAYLRVRIRRQVLPALEEAAGGHATVALARFAAFAAEDEAFLAGAAEHTLHRVSWPDGSLEQAAVNALERPIARRVVSGWLRHQGVAVDGELMIEVLGALESGRTTPLPCDRVLACKNGRVWVWPSPPRHLHITSKEGAGV